MPRNPQPIPSVFIFEITGSELDYMFASRPRKDDPDPYWESVTLNLDGLCLYPINLKDRVARLSFEGSRDLPKPSERSWRVDARGVGYLEADKARFRYSGSIPADAMGWLAPAFPTKQVRFLVLDGDSLIRGRAIIRGCGFHATYDPRDYF